MDKFRKFNFFDWHHCNDKNSEEFLMQATASKSHFL